MNVGARAAHTRSRWLWGLPGLHSSPEAARGAAQAGDGQGTDLLADGQRTMFSCPLVLQKLPLYSFTASSCWRSEVSPPMWGGLYARFSRGHSRMGLTLVGPGDLTFLRGNEELQEVAPHTEPQP